MNSLFMRHIKRLAKIDEAVAQLSAKEPKTEAVNDVLDQLRSVRSEASKGITRFRVGLVGRSGSGKSTLISSLAGIPYLLANEDPSFLGVTMAPTEVEHDPHHIPGRFTLTVGCLTSGEWYDARKLMASELQSLTVIKEKAKSKQEIIELNGSIKFIEECFQRLYFAGAATVDEVKSSIHELAKIIIERDYTDPDSITELIDRHMITFENLTLEDLQKKRGEFLERTGRFHPLVTIARITGHFDKIPRGVTLVDLPGVFDSHLPVYVQDRIAQLVNEVNAVWFVQRNEKLVNVNNPTALGSCFQEGSSSNALGDIAIISHWNLKKPPTQDHLEEFFTGLGFNSGFCVPKNLFWTDSDQRFGITNYEPLFDRLGAISSHLHEEVSKSEVLVATIITQKVRLEEEEESTRRKKVLEALRDCMMNRLSKSKEDLLGACNTLRRKYKLLNYNTLECLFYPGSSGRFTTSGERAMEFVVCRFSYRRQNITVKLISFLQGKSDLDYYEALEGVPRVLPA